MRDGVALIRALFCREPPRCGGGSSYTLQPTPTDYTLSGALLPIPSKQQVWLLGLYNKLLRRYAPFTSDMRDLASHAE